MPLTPQANEPPGVPHPDYIVLQRSPKCQFPLDAPATRGPAWAGQVLQARPAGASTAHSHAPAPVVAGRYRIMQRVAQKRVSAVYRARDEQTGATVALKMLETTGLVTAAEKRQAIASFQREAERLAPLRHPRIAGVLDHFVERETCYLITTWVDGVTLRELHDAGPVPEGKLRAIGAQIADVLAFLHSQQPPAVVRDLKMSHVMLTATGDAYLLDLGLGRFFKPGQSGGSAERGTAPYEAPEQAAFGYAGPQADIYALGTLLLALQRGPAGGAPPRAPSTQLQRVLTLSRQKDPDKRYANAAQMRDDLGGGVPMPHAPAPEAMPGAPAPAAPTVELLTPRLRVLRRSDRDESWFRVRLRNLAGTPVHLSVTPKTQWLVARQPELDLAPGEGEVLIGARLASLPRQDTTVERAVLFEGGTPLWLSVEVVDQEPRLDAPATLDFGDLGGPQSRGMLRLANAGGGVLTVQMTGAYPWLRPARTEVVLRGGDTIEVPVVVTTADAPAAGEYERALRLDSDSGQAWVAARFGRAEAEMVIEPRRVDLGSSRTSDPIETTLSVGNRGDGPLDVRLTAQSSAITIAPARLTVPPRHRATLHLTVQVGALPPGEHSFERGIRVSGNAGTVDVPVTITVMRPLLGATERELDFGSLDVGQVTQATLPLVISNRGNVPLEYTVELGAPWLRVWPVAGELPAGGSTVLEARLSGEAAQTPGAVALDRAMSIIGGGTALPVAARFTLVKPLLVVEPASLDFGLIPAGGVTERTATITNSGSGVLEWTATTDSTWLEVSPASGSLPAGAHAEVVLRSYALGLPAEAHEARATMRFRGQHNERTVTAAVAVSRPQLVVDPLLDLGESVDLAPASGRLILFNRGVGDLSGSVTPAVPWLAVEPASFRVPTGGSTALLVTASPPAGSVLGALTLPAAVAVHSGGGDATIDVHVALVALPRIEVAPDRLLLKAGTEGAIIVRNAGLGPYRGKVRASMTWLTVRPAMLTIRPGQRARVTVTADVPSAELPAEASITVGTGEHQQSVEVIVS